MYVERDFPESYVDRFYEERAGGGYGLTEENFFWWHEATKDSNHYILSQLGKHDSRRMLEIGCGIGTFLADARDLGWDITGLEINPDFPEFCRRSIGVPVECGRASAPPFAPASFHVIAMLDVLEHTYDPVLALKQAGVLLKPGGLMVVKSPNGPMQLRKERFKKRMGRGNGYVAELGHLNQFSPRTLALAFSSSGLETVTVRPAPSFQQGISGPGFTFRRVARHAFILAANFSMRISGQGLNLVGIARKPAA